MSISSQAALTHLRTIKPQDGWSVQRDASLGTMTLLRRNVPLTDNPYLDIHYDSSSGCVVGILGHNQSTKTAQAQVLVDASGRPSNGGTIVMIKTYDPNSAANVSFEQTRAAASSASAASASTSTGSIRSTQARSATTTSASTPSHIPESALSREENIELLKKAAMFVAASMVFRLIFSNVVVFYGIAFPLLYFYALQTCPAESSFDAKKELKRVLRGYHLPENDPRKPKGFLEGLAARVAASVTTELATLPGYEIQMVNMAGAAIITTVTVPAVKLDCYWVGAFNTWYYITSREIPDAKYD